jgi:lantibiotic modifying enzyme
VLAQYWPEALSAFEEISSFLRRLDAAGLLEERLNVFHACRVRIVLRATEVYAELGRMLWHPVAMHDEGSARRRAAELLERMSRNVAVAPGDPEVIDGELRDLLIGDFPMFTALVSGDEPRPLGLRHLKFSNLLLSALHRWRDSSVAFDLKVVRATLVSAYLNDGR